MSAQITEVCTGYFSSLDSFSIGIDPSSSHKDWTHAGGPLVRQCHTSCVFTTFCPV
jgi:hypothetical protein